ncbi:hypothetical protein [Streptomyces smyrnaeus]|uniref:hypothetical protein n=1 Tax=Streptomyces smyrnaeus TaxID=1387713 RepID=UPI0033C24E98
MPSTIRSMASSDTGCSRHEDLVPEEIAFGDGGGSRRAGQAAALVVIVAAKLDVGSTRCVSRTRLGSARAGRLTRPAAFDVT